MAIDNDTRGWIMASISGLACILGASVICVDIIARLIPRWRNFRIQDSNRFLAASLSLSAGVMIYSALYSMLPSSKGSLIKGGWSPSPAAFTMIGCFLGGVIGIQVLSKLMHRFLPSHIVDCDHTHKDEEHHEIETVDDLSMEGDTEDRPLLSRAISHEGHYERPTVRKAQTEVGPQLLATQAEEKPSIGSKIVERMSSFIQDSRVCAQGKKCFGYSNPCGNECYKVISQNPNKPPFTSVIGSYGALTTNASTDLRRQPNRSMSVPNGSCLLATENGHVGHGKRASSSSSTLSNVDSMEEMVRSGHSHVHDHSDAKTHHHHVASNAFLSIGLQTSIAIALHKLPEGFITYATNHANPRLGVSIFMALFIHNITEGFALALPLYLAFNNRLKAMIWASILGGASQPLGAGIAALWFKVAQSRDMTPSEGVYGIMFAITAGIMTNVALQLFSESLSLIHHKGLCISMAFVGMGILGFSNALTAS